MSRSFFFTFRNIVSSVRQGNILLTCGLVGTHLLYTLGTSGEQDIQVTKKYKFVRNGLTDFMVIDKENKHYNVNNSVWYWKWDSVEDWNTMNVNDNIKIKYYGVRFPMLGLFPNIVGYKKI